MAHELFNFGVAGRRDFAGRDQLQPNAAGTVRVKNVPTLRVISPKRIPTNEIPHIQFSWDAKSFVQPAISLKLSAHNSAAQ
jgi:hypothetical protein